ncbi:unnamed protein product [Trichogramma brassicae]|uniref:Uncharacterized protein n=1 Tax=Trichogramma brassicae TaxID=86971 RepID=A0A6H5I0Y9_9HYME|nr:unnamed protein product [Trichogramma brassicae]
MSLVIFIYFFNTVEMSIYSESLEGRSTRAWKSSRSRIRRRLLSMYVSLTCAIVLIYNIAAAARSGFSPSSSSFSSLAAAVAALRSSSSTSSAPTWTAAAAAVYRIVYLVYTWSIQHGAAIRRTRRRRQKIKEAQIEFRRTDGWMNTAERAGDKGRAVRAIKMAGNNFLTPALSLSRMEEDQKRRKNRERTSEEHGQSMRRTRRKRRKRSVMVAVFDRQSNRI